jgi:hypothetical protein
MKQPLALAGFLFQNALLAQAPFISRIQGPDMIMVSHQDGGISSNGDIALVSDYLAPIWDYNVVVYDSLGQFVWGTRRIPETEGDALLSPAVRSAWTTEGNLVVCGPTASGSGIGACAFSVEGELLWSRRYDLPADETPHEVAIEAAADGGVYISMNTWHPALMHVAATGSMAWCKRFASLISTTRAPAIAIDQDSGPTIAYGSFDDSASWYLRLEHLNVLGEPQWERKVARAMDGITGLLRTNDGGYLSIGTATGGNAMALINAQGDLVWAKQYTVANPYPISLAAPEVHAGGIQVHIKVGLLSACSGLTMELGPNGEPDEVNGFPGTWLNSTVLPLGRYDGLPYYFAYLHPPGIDGGLLEIPALFRVGNEMELPCSDGSTLPVTATDVPSVSFDPFNTWYGATDVTVQEGPLGGTSLDVEFLTDDGCAVIAGVTEVLGPAAPMLITPSPAPLGTTISITIGAQPEKLRMVCSATDGRTLMNLTYPPGSGPFEISTQGWSAGLYHLRAMTIEGRVIASGRVVLE